MNYFWDTRETIPAGMGFPLFGTVHLATIALMVLSIWLNCIYYRKLDSEKRSLWRKTVGALLLLDELFKLLPMLVTGRFLWDYLPFHLCSINLFLINYHAWHPSKALDNFLYTVCIPGALAAMLFSSWTKLPAWNYKFLHSVSVHILLVMYPVVLFVNKEIVPDWRELPKTLLLLLGLGAIALVLNLLLDTNFMFLMDPETGNPLELFEKLCGNHLVGFPVLVTAVIGLMHIPLIVSKRIKEKKNPTA